MAARRGDTTKRRNKNTLGSVPEIKGGSQPLEEKTNEQQSSYTVKGHLKNFFIYTLLLLVIPPFLNYTALIREDRELKQEGDLNETFIGQKLFVQCKGKGRPTVILDAPSGFNSDVWNKIYEEVSKISKVCIYDRAGIGLSERPKIINSSIRHGTFHTTERMVDDLRFLFSNKTSHEKPLLLVGAELGAVNARFYAQMYQDDVTSLVLINPLFDGLFSIDNGEWEKFWLGPFLRTWQRLHILAVCGLSRIGLHLGAMKAVISAEDLPHILQMKQNHLLCKPGHLYSAVEEHYLLNESLSQIRLLNKLRPLSETIPVTTLTSSKYSDLAPENANRVWKKSQTLYKGSLHKSSREVKMDASADRLLIDKQYYTKIVKIISDDVKKWREDSKKVSKY